MSRSLRRFELLLSQRFNRQLLLEFKERLKTRIPQIDIWLSTYLIEAL